MTIKDPTALKTRRYTPCEIFIFKNFLKRCVSKDTTGKTLLLGVSE